MPRDFVERSVAALPAHIQCMSEKMRNRQPAGIPVGGEYAKESGASVGLALAPISPSFVEQRKEQLRGLGFVPAVATKAMVTPGRPGDTSAWWDTHQLQAEYGDYPQMPEAGLYASDRRTVRRTYRNGGVRLQMPSKSAIRAYSELADDVTFDVPVSASTPEGDVQGWVRVTRYADDHWETTSLGFPDTVGEGVAEVVSATLENRSVGRSKADYGMIVARRRALLAERGSQITPLGREKHFIKGFGYDDPSGVMVVDMGGTNQDGTERVYGYQVPRAVFDAAMKAESPGSVYNRLVKGQPRTPVGKCPECGRFYAANGAHECPSPHKPAPGSDAYTTLARRAALDAQPVHKESKAPAKPSVDLEAILAERAAQPYAESGTQGAYGRRGWTMRVAGRLNDFVDESHNRESYSTGRRPGGRPMTAFNGLDERAARDLLREVPSDALTAREGLGPTLGTILRSVASHPGAVEAHGHVVGPENSSERITGEGVLIYGEDDLDETAILYAARDKYGIVDAKHGPTWLDKVETPWRTDADGKPLTAWRLAWAA